MADESTGYTPFHHAKIARTQHAHETLFHFMRGPDRFRCEVRDLGAWGTDAQFFKNDEFFYSHRHPTRELAIAWATHERAAIERGATT